MARKQRADEKSVDTRQATHAARDVLSRLGSGRLQPQQLSHRLLPHFHLSGSRFDCRDMALDKAPWGHEHPRDRRTFVPVRPAQSLQRGAKTHDTRDRGARGSVAAERATHGPVREDGGRQIRSEQVGSATVVLLGRLPSQRVFGVGLAAPDESMLGTVVGSYRRILER